MATRKSVVVIGGLLSELPAGDVLAGTEIATYTIEIDFGSIPSYGRAFLITDSNVLATSKVAPFQSADPATGRLEDENEMDGLICSSKANAGSFNLYVMPMPGPVTGKYKINYSIG